MGLLICLELSACGSAFRALQDQYLDFSNGKVDLFCQYGFNNWSDTHECTHILLHVVLLYPCFLNILHINKEK